ncbi:Ribose methyltransferase [Halocaridina rubra]|uniref:rRNA methyltransferase 1, mitochondrial n=1 Tax=Halocaridina rubra TaxID=373956 RepID=A0AAN8WE30_HALRR
MLWSYSCPDMLSRVIIRYASQKSFSLPRTNFRYAQQDVESIKEKEGSSDFRVDQKRITYAPEKKLKRYTQKNNNRKDEVLIKISENRIVLPVSSDIALDGKKDKLTDNRYLKKYDSSPNFSKRYNEKQKARRLKLEGKYNKVKLTKSNPKGEFIFGIHPVYHALQAERRQIHSLYFKSGLENTNVKIKEILDLAEQRGIYVKAVNSLQLEKYVGEDRVHQGICGDVSVLPYQNLDVESVLQEFGLRTDDSNPVLTDRNLCEESAQNEGKSSDEAEDIVTEPQRQLPIKSYQLWLYMDRIQDPMNFGAILRSAYFLGVDRVLASKENSCRLSGIVSKASAGAAELIPVHQVADIKHLFNILSNCGWSLVSTAAKGMGSSRPLNEYEPCRNIVLAIGNEGLGISPDIQDMFKTTITIPPGRSLPSGMDSLNVSVATAVILHSVIEKLSLLKIRQEKCR